MTIPPMTGRALTMGMSHVTSRNPPKGCPGGCYRDPTVQVRRLRLGEAEPCTQLGWESLPTPEPTGLTTLPPRVSQVTKAVQVS